MPPAPKPIRAQKKKRQRVLIRCSADDWRMGFRTDVVLVDGEYEAIYALGTKYTTEYAALVDILDDLCSDIVRRRDGYQCVLCGSRVQPQNGHVLVRGKWGTRFDLLNQHTQCASCNIRHGKAQQAWYYYNWFKAKFGELAWSELCRRAEEKRDAKAWSIPELRALVVKYEDVLDTLEHLAIHDFETLRRMGYYGAIPEEK